MQSVGHVVAEGRFRPPRVLFGNNGLNVSGSAVVQIVRRSDGAFVLRLSQVAIVNPLRVRLQLLLWLKDPGGGTRTLKNKWLDTFGDLLWMNAAGEGGWGAGGR
jgi:hypothetical protein